LPPSATHPKVSDFAAITWWDEPHYQAPRVPSATAHTTVAWRDHPHHQVLSALVALYICSYRLTVQTLPSSATPITRFYCFYTLQNQVSPSQILVGSL